ncbi:homoserine dehydrogenase [Caproicibacterium sp. NSD3]
MIEIAVLGYGVVGSGVVEILTTHADSIAQRAKEKINVKYILIRRDHAESSLQGEFTKSFDEIVDDPDIKIVVEAIGGLNPAYEYVRRSLEAGKSVVTSNKELVASKGAELLKIAQEKNLNFLFEASVGGGIPILRPISQCLAANDVVGICGILNGTTNFILTKMFHDNMSFEDALKLAQKLGYAEHDPSADIEGMDACRKICILASLTYGHHVYPEQVHTEGITEIRKTDVEYADSWHGVIKLIGEVKKEENGRLQIIVCPMFIPSDSQIATVDNVFNAIMVRGDATGDVLFYGKGAGKLPTASAVVADVIDCVKHLKARKYLFWDAGSPDYIDDYTKDIRAFYVCAKYNEDAEKGLALAKKEFPTLEHLKRKNAPLGEFAFVTDAMQEYEFRKKCIVLKKAGMEIQNTIRVGDM